VKVLLPAGRLRERNPNRAKSFVSSHQWPEPECDPSSSSSAEKNERSCTATLHRMISPHGHGRLPYSRVGSPQLTRSSRFPFSCTGAVIARFLANNSCHSLRFVCLRPDHIASRRGCVALCGQTCWKLSAPSVNKSWHLQTFGNGRRVPVVYRVTHSAMVHTLRSFSFRHKQPTAFALPIFTICPMSNSIT
jgi:hypothetical protein